MSLINSTAIPSGASAYEIEQSLRFDQNTSTSLSKTPTSAGNRTTWTYSVWMKLGQFGDGWNMIFNAGQSDGGGSAGTRLTGLLMYNSTLYIYWDSASGGTNPAMKLRDNSAWYHVCLVATSSSLACYINGTLAGTKSGSGNGAINNTQAHAIGSRADTANSYFNGLMSEAHFIDGTAKAPTDFAETGDYGEWKPVEYSGSYGTNGFYLNFAGGGIMSATGGNSTATDGDFKAASFTANGTFTPSADGYVEYLVIGGGGAGAADGATTAGNGGGGAGGYRTGYLPVTASTAYSIAVGAGGAGTTGSSQVNGANSVFSSITSAGGGGGGYFTSTPGAAGGSGGGGSAQTAAGGAANPAGQGNAGETATNGQGGGGGGGAGEAGGTDGTGQGGDGLASSITGSSVTRAGGGGGSRVSGGARAGGTGGGGAGGSGTAGTSGTANTGSGGGAGVSGGSAGSGGSGIVIIRYKFQ